MGKQGSGNGKRDDAHARRQAIIDGLLADALRPAFTYRLPSQESLPADIRKAIDRLLAKAEAQRSRCLTYDDLEEEPIEEEFAEASVEEEPVEEGDFQDEYEPDDDYE